MSTVDRENLSEECKILFACTASDDHLFRDFQKKMRQRNAMSSSREMVIYDFLQRKVGRNRSNDDIISDNISLTSYKTWAENIQSDRIEEATRIRESLNKSINFSEQEGNITCFLRSMSPNHKPRQNKRGDVYRHTYPCFIIKKGDKNEPKAYSSREFEKMMKQQNITLKKRVRTTPSA